MIPQESVPGELPLVLGPKGVFSQPLSIVATPTKRPVVLFHAGRSLVRLGEDSAAWRWLQQKRQENVDNYLNKTDDGYDLY